MKKEYHTKILRSSSTTKKKGKVYRYIRYLVYIPADLNDLVKNKKEAKITTDGEKIIIEI